MNIRNPHWAWRYETRKVIYRIAYWLEGRVARLRLADWEEIAWIQMRYRGDL
jgi:hypothetical protein